jgi:hypothetical protein
MSIGRVGVEVVAGGGGQVSKKLPVIREGTGRNS